jgi:serine protease
MLFFRRSRLPTLSRGLYAVPWLWAVGLSVLPAHAAAPKPGTRPAVAAEDPSEARVIVKYRSTSTLMQALSATGGTTGRTQPLHATMMGQRLGLPMQDGRVLDGQTQSLRGQGLSSSQLAARLAQQAEVEWAVPDERRYVAAAPNDPYYGPNQTTITPTVGQWYLRAPDATIVSAINAVGAWDTTKGAATVTVAVLDTGVRYEHPDFTDSTGASKLWPGTDFVSDSTSPGSGDGTDPGTWTTTNQCGAGTGSSSSDWHGTQTAGIVAAATDNAIGMASVGRNVKVLPVRVIGKCGAFDSDIIAAMYWAAGLSSTPRVNAHPAQVISMSLGKSGSCPSSYNAVFTALAAAKVTVVVAAGNDEGLAVGAPANCNGALAVTGLRHVGTKVGFSSIGTAVAISAPGGNCVNTTGPCLYPILTTTNAGTTTPSSSTYSDSTNPSVGTSFSTPMVAGTVALMLSVDSTLSPTAIRSALQATARPFPTSGSGAAIVQCRAPTTTAQDECYCTTSTCGAGMLDAAAAVAAVVPAPVAVAPPVAAISVSSSTPTAGASVTLSATGSSANGGRALTGYQWQITSGSGLAAFSGSTTGSSATLVTSAAGAVTVSLTVTDSASATGTTSSTVNVQAAAAVPTSGGGSTTSSGGGGAMSPAWLGLLALAAAALRGAVRRA